MSALSRPSKSPPKEYREVVAAFESNSILTASKAELEQYLIGLGKDRVLSEENRVKAAEMGETIRLFLSARQSQEMHGQSMIVARVALYVALIALFLSAAQLLLAIPAVSRVLGFD